MAVNVIGGGHCTCKLPLLACTITQFRHCACLFHATQLARRGSQSLRDSTAALTHALQVSTLFLAAVMLRTQWFMGSTLTQCVLARCSSVTGLKLSSTSNHSPNCKSRERWHCILCQSLQLTFESKFVLKQTVTHQTKTGSHFFRHCKQHHVSPDLGFY